MTRAAWTLLTTPTRKCEGTKMRTSIVSLLALGVMVAGCGHGPTSPNDPQIPGADNGVLQENDRDAAVASSRGGDSAAPVRDEEAAFQTDRLRYTVESTALGGINGHIGYVFTNPTRAPVHFTGCRGVEQPVLEKWVDGQWVTALPAVILDCRGSPIVVQPGREYRGSVDINGVGPEVNAAPKFSVDSIPGTYRFVWHKVFQAYDDAHRELLPLAQRISNRFYLDTE